ncbi:RelA/SpoT domain-containing protein [Streptomyces sp. NPDC126497]|uniref:GTP pyrophosphokinase n=1 Tax=Streptomyces sp. NPDC126497 TaxID=3155313 RepID=UPI00331F4EFD
MELIEQFIDRYTKEYDYYSQAARLVAQMLESDLRSSGVRCIVTHRAKDIERLREKCIQRNSRSNYESVEEIFRDIVDLAGVRVALYFPGEQEQVDKSIARLFKQWDEKRVFPAAGQEKDDPAGQKNDDRRFSGYSAVHYRVQPREQYIGDANKRYLKARVEIQVASVLMHAWSEVQHDLVYKQMDGDLSDEEYAILDQLNGLVIAGEISLKLLQDAGEARVARNGTSFLNHYELAAHLLRHASDSLSQPIGDSGLGRVDDLFKLLKQLNKTTPAELKPYLESLHGAVEKRPLAEQVIDALLAEDSSRYVAYNEIRDTSQLGRSELERETGRAMRDFLHSWVELENTLNRLARNAGQSQRYKLPMVQLLRSVPMPPGIREELDLLRLMRNDVVHHRRDLPPTAFDDATNRIKEIAEGLDDGAAEASHST